MEKPRVLFLQGLASPFFNRVAERLLEHGCHVAAIHCCLPDRLFWRGPNGVSYRGAIEQWGDFFERFVIRHRITDILLVGEQRTYHVIAIERAHALGVRVHVTDNGYLRPDWLILERDGTNGESHFPRDPARIRALAAGLPEVDMRPRYRDAFWKLAILDMAYHFTLAFSGFLYPRYRRSYRRDNPFLHYPAIGLRLLRKPARERHAARTLQRLVDGGGEFFVHAMQLEHDFSIVSYSPFDNLEQAAERIVGSFARHAPDGCHLLVKLHPLDTGIKNWARIIARIAGHHGVASRVLFVDGGDLDAMIERARGVVLVNSTVGVRAIQLGRPVKPLGQALYDIEGLAHPGELDGFWRDPVAPDPELARDWIRLLASMVHVRGGYYSDPGLAAAANETADRIVAGRVGEVFTDRVTP